jgi:hypothetical protein
MKLTFDVFEVNFGLEVLHKFGLLQNRLLGVQRQEVCHRIGMIAELLKVLSTGRFVGGLKVKRTP